MLMAAGLTGATLWPTASHGQSSGAGPAAPRGQTACVACGGNGHLAAICAFCAGRGVCVRCGGNGVVAMFATASSTQLCPACEGSSVCFKCEGSGHVTELCATCRGRGRGPQSQGSDEGPADGPGEDGAPRWNSLGGFDDYIALVRQLRERMAAGEITHAPLAEVAKHPENFRAAIIRSRGYLPVEPGRHVAVAAEPGGPIEYALIPDSGGVGFQARRLFRHYGPNHPFLLLYGIAGSDNWTIFEITAEEIKPVPAPTAPREPSASQE